MAKINRFNGNLKAFAADSTSTNRTVFGDSSQSDTLDANLNSDFFLGWQIVDPSGVPTKQDFNAVSFALGQVLAYIHQMGIPEWNTSQEYPENGHCIGSDGFVYRSLISANIGNNPVSDAVNWQRVTQNVADTNLGLEWKNGLLVTNNATDPDHDLDFAAGSIMDSTLAVRLTLPSAMTKKLDLPWAAGTGNGGMCNQDNSGDLEADETYHDYIIGKADGTTDCISAKRGTDPLSDTNAIAAGYIYKRRVMTEQTRAAGTILPRFLRFQNYVTWSIPYSVTTTVSTTGALSISQSPPLQTARLSYELAAQTSTSQESVARGYISQEEQTNVAPTTLYSQVTSQVTAQGLGNFTTLTSVTRGTVDVVCNASQQFRHRETSDAQAIHINSLGWFNDITVETGA